MTKIVGVSFGTKNGNNDALCKEALMGAKEAGCEVEFIRAMDLNIKHCTGCITCVKMLMSGRGNMCIHKDDFDWLAFKMFNADGVIITDPIFEKGASGLFHTIMDRFGPRMDTGNNYIATQIAEANIAQGKPGKVPDPVIMSPKVVSYISIGGSEWGTHAQSDHQIQSMTPTWKVIDNEWVQWAKAAIMDDEVVARAHQIGVNLAEAAKDIPNAKYQGPAGVCPHCGCNDFYIVPGTTTATCTVCGLDGTVSIENDAVVVTYTEEELVRAHDTPSGKEIHGRDIQRNEAKLAELQQGDEYKARNKRYKDFISASMPERA